MIEKRKPYRNKKILQAARYEICTMNSPWCTYNQEETCARHLNESYAGKGGSQKADDYAIFYGCQGCENWYTLNPKTSKEEKSWYVLRAVIRTWRRLLDRGILK